MEQEVNSVKSIRHIVTSVTILNVTPRNRLQGETSPYLLQHMDNPVDWYPWGEEALLFAQTHDRPLLISIGYSACHWCHVMERESFEDETVSELMNNSFVNIKIDREERPDLDQIYMDTVVRLTGHGGWPLTVFCTSDGRPFYGGTYFPPVSRHGLPSFRELLLSIDKAYKNRREDIENTAEKLLFSIGGSQTTNSTNKRLDLETVKIGVDRLMKGADAIRGGFAGAPKFPTPTNLELLLTSLNILDRDSCFEIESFLSLTCKEMSRRGLFDQLGGGFHRYCVDDHWGIPHFEKMLYDQGQLLRIYAQLWRKEGERNDFSWPIRETARYLEREMTVKDGGLAASQDADSEGIEGKFYVWNPEEIVSILGLDDANAFSENYSVTAQGNFEGSSVLWDTGRHPREKFTSLREELFAARGNRTCPQRDDKRIAAWNALTASGLAYAGSLLLDRSILAQAESIGDFIWNKMRNPSGRLQRVYAKGKIRVGAFLDDLAATTHACLDLYRAGCGNRFATRAIFFAEDILERFYDSEESDLFLTPSNAPSLIIRPRTDHDGATPQSVGFAILALLRVSALTGHSDFLKVAESVLEKHADQVLRKPEAFPTLLRAIVGLEHGFSTAVIVGEFNDLSTQTLADKARSLLEPDEAIIVVSPSSEIPEMIDPTLLESRIALNGKATAYICLGTSCRAPVQDPNDLMKWHR